MKTLITILVLLLLCGSLPAAPVLVMIATVNNSTSNSPAVLALQNNPPLQQFSITHGTLPSTNALTVTFQATADQTNYINVGSWHPSNTNAATEIITQPTYFVTNYVRIAVTTTNSYTTSTTYGL